MGRQRMFVYDYDGRRVKLEKSSDSQKDKSEDSSFSLPPVENKEDIMSSRSVSEANVGPTQEEENVEMPKDKKSEEMRYNKYNVQTNGLLTDSMLTRRGTVRSIDDLSYLPRLHHRASTIRTSRSEPSWMDYSRMQKLAYERYHAADRLFLRDGNFRKTAPHDKLVTFYKDFESVVPEIRLIVSPARFRNVRELIDNLSRLIDIGNRRFIHSQHGQIIRDVSEFEDGGIYFFGPPHIYESNDYNLFRRQATPDLLDSELADVTLTPRAPPVSLYRRRRKIKIIFNNNKLHAYSFVVDTGKHKSLLQILQDLTDLVPYGEQGHVEKVCTRNGKTIQSIQEFFQTTDELFLAISWNSPYHHQYAVTDRPYYPTYHNYLRKNQVDYYERSLLQPFEINIKGKTHEFEPPNIEYIDPLIKRFDIPPFEHLEMEWVYGYNGKNCRNNIVMLPSDEIVYFIAKIVIVYNLTSQKHRFYTEHTEELRSIAQHPNLWIVATGQSSGTLQEETGHIRIWDSKSMITLNVLSLNDIDLSVECLAFSQSDDGIKLASITTSEDEWVLRVWDWEEANIICSSEPYMDVELMCAFDPSDSATLVSCGKDHVSFWNVLDMIASCEDGAFDGHPRAEYVTCLSFDTEHVLITADSSGNIQIWDKIDRVVISNVVTEHTGSIITIKALHDRCILTGGGSDKTLCLIKHDEELPTLNKVQLSNNQGGIVAIASNNLLEGDPGEMMLYLGTSMNKILQGSMDAELQCVVNGTSDDVTALAVKTSDKKFLSAGVDTAITLWSTADHTQIWETNIDISCTAASLHTNGEIAAIGTSSGEWLVFELGEPQQIGSYQCDNSPVTCLSYSENSAFLAAGTDKGSVFLYHCFNEGKGYRHMQSIKSRLDPISSVDWSVNATHLRYVTTRYDNDIWNIESRQKESNPHYLRNVQFDQHTTSLNYYTAGIWNNVGANTMFTACIRSPNNSLFCVGTDAGSIRLYHYPCDTKLALFNEVSGHCGPVSQVAFTAAGQSVISSGENDCCIIQWKLAKKELSNDQRYKEAQYPTRYDLGVRTRLSQRHFSKIPVQKRVTRPKTLMYPEK